MSIKYIKIFLLIALFEICYYNSFSQVKQDTLKSKFIELPKLTVINNVFLSIIDSLVAGQQKCSYYDSSLIWTISSKKTENNRYEIHITMISGLYPLIDLHVKILGYFHYKKLLFLVTNNFIEDVFSKTNNEKKRFHYKIWVPHNEDWSSWYYTYENRVFLLKEAYPLPCLRSSKN